MYANVVVKTKIPSIGKTFIYRIPKDLEDFAKIGYFVEIPFGKKLTQGIIFSLENYTEIKNIKYIKRIKVESNILNKDQLKLAQWISNRYLCNFYDSINIMHTYKDTQEINEFIKPAFNSKINLNKDQENILKKLKYELENNINNKHLLFGVTGSGKTEIYLRIANEYLKKNKQILFLVPEISLTPQLKNIFSTAFGDNSVAVINSSLSKKIKNNYINDIINQKRNIVIGSRSAILTAFNNLGLIIIDECHDRSYKQENNPKYNTIDLAEYISKDKNISLIIGSATPLIEQYYTYNNAQLLKLPNKINRNVNKNIVVNIKEDRYTTNSSLSKTLVNKMLKILEHKKQILLYINRRGLHNSILCNNCGFIEECPKCNISLTLHKIDENNLLVCHYCFFKKKFHKQCQNCKSYFIRGNGIGTQSIFQEVKNLFPKYKIEIADSDNVNSALSYESIYKNFLKGKTDILIGTQMITKGWDVHNVSLTCYLLLESDLSFPSFRTNQNIYANIIQLSGRGGRGKEYSTNIIQTYNVNSSLLNFAINNNYIDFYNLEINKRKILNYPPFSFLIQIIKKDKNLKKNINDTKKIKNTLYKEFNRLNIKDNIDVIGPSKCIIFKVKYIYNIQLLLRINNNEKIIEEVITILKEVKEKFDIEINILPYELK